MGSTHEAISFRGRRAEPPSHSLLPIASEISHAVDIWVSVRCSRLHRQRMSQERDPRLERAAADARASRGNPNHKERSILFSGVESGCEAANPQNITKFENHRDCARSRLQKKHIRVDVSRMPERRLSPAAPCSAHSVRGVAHALHNQAASRHACRRRFRSSAKTYEESTRLQRQAPGCSS